MHYSETLEARHRDCDADSMRGEHARVRILCRELTAAVAAEDADGVGEVVDTLLLLLQHRDAKWGAALYPMADRTPLPDLALASATKAAG